MKIRKSKPVRRSTLTLYLLGPGIGESIVAIMPDRRVIVVDSCECDGDNLPATLLTHLGIAQVDLLVVTHPDLDHITGITELVTRFSPSRVWRYPFGLLRDMLQMMTRLETPTGKQRYAEALAANDALDILLTKAGTVVRVHAGQTWAPTDAGYVTHVLAPTPYDVERAAHQIRGLLEKRRGKLVLAEHARGWFAGGPLGDLPNMVSLGLVIEWQQRKVLLAGDVGIGTGHAHSGWRGILAALDQPDERRGHLVDNVDVVKIAHHGSSGALVEDAWTRHAASDKTIGVVATFSPTPLPDNAALRSFRRWVSRLGIATDAGDAFDRALAAGWVTADPGAAATLPMGPCLKIELDASGASAFERGGEAGWFK